MKKNVLNTYAKNHKFYIASFLAVIIIVSFLAPLKSFLMKWLVDSKTTTEAFKYLLFGSIIIISNFLFSCLGDIMFSKIETESIKNVRNILMKIFLKKNN